MEFIRHAPEGSTDLVTLRNVSVFYLGSSTAHGGSSHGGVGDVDGYSRIGRSGGEPVVEEDIMLAIQTRSSRFDRNDSRAITVLEAQR